MRACALLGLQQDMFMIYNWWVENYKALCHNAYAKAHRAL